MNLCGPQELIPTSGFLLRCSIYSPVLSGIHMIIMLIWSSAVRDHANDKLTFFPDAAGKMPSQMFTTWITALSI